MTAQVNSQQGQNEPENQTSFLRKIALYLLTCVKKQKHHKYTKAVLVRDTESKAMRQATPQFCLQQLFHEGFKTDTQQLHPLQGVQCQADSFTDEELDTTPDASLLMNSSTMEELIDQLTSSPIPGQVTNDRGLTFPSLLVDEAEAVDEALANLQVQLPISPSLVCALISCGLHMPIFSSLFFSVVVPSVRCHNKYIIVVSFLPQGINQLLLSWQ